MENHTTHHINLILVLFIYHRWLEEKSYVLNQASKGLTVLINPAPYMAIVCVIVLLWFIIFNLMFKIREEVEEE